MMVSLTSVQKNIMIKFMEVFVTAFLGISTKVHFRKKMTSQMAEGFFPRIQSKENSRENPKDSRKLMCYIYHSSGSHECFMKKM